MKFKKQTSRTRTRTYFAFFPVSVYVKEVKETRWLETVTVYEEQVDGDACEYWKPLKFIDKYDDIEHL